MAVATGRRAPWATRVVSTVNAWARRWARVLGTSAGTAAVAGAAQLGLAYGLGILHLPTGIPANGVWETQLTWVAWVAALAVLGGAAGGAWTARHGAVTDRAGSRARLEFGQRIVVVLTAAAGAGVVIYLTALPARTIELSGIDPALEAALVALLGIVVGILAAVTALSVRVAAVSIATVVMLVWLIALVSVTPTLGPEAPPALVRLGVLDLPLFGDGARSTVARLSAPLLALLVGTALAAAARSRGLSRWHTVVAGTAGPLLLGLPYLIAPPAGDDGAVHAPAFGGALAAVGIAALGAIMLALARMPHSPGGGPPPGDDGGPGAWGPPTRATATVPAGGPVVPDQGTPPGPVPPAPMRAPEPELAPEPEPEPVKPFTPWATTAPAPEPEAPAPQAPAPQAPAQPGPEVAGSQDTTPAAKPGRAAKPRKRRRRRAEEEDRPHPEQDLHMDWVRALGQESEEDDASLGKRRLRDGPDASDPDGFR